MVIIMGYFEVISSSWESLANGILQKIAYCGKVLQEWGRGLRRKLHAKVNSLKRQMANAKGSLDVDPQAFYPN